MPEPTGSCNLQIFETPGARVARVDDQTWRLSIPASKESVYHCAQLDDYKQLARRNFPYEAGSLGISVEEDASPTTELSENHEAGRYLSMEARVSEPDLPGTWGFGLWNDPFQVKLGVKGTDRRLPALPNAAWFFHASTPNYLAFGDDHPAQGMLAAVFSSPQIPAWVLAAAIPLIPFLGIRLTARYLRKAIHKIIREDAICMTNTVTDWHQYELYWKKDQVRFIVNGIPQWSTTIVPQGRLGLVIWIDNQYASFRRDGVIKTGALAIESNHWMEVRNIQVG